MALSAVTAKFTTFHGNFVFRALTVNAVAVAITGVAFAIFSSQTFAMIGYAILGISSGILGFWGSTNLELFGKMQASMEQDVVLMQKANQRTAELTGQIAQEDALLKQNAVSLQAEVKAFKSQNAELQKQLKTMESQLQRLQQTNKDLNKTKSALEKTVNDLQKSYDAVQIQVQQFLSLNLQMGQSVGAFQETDKNLAKTAQDLQGAVTRLSTAEADASNLADQIEIGRKSMQQIVDYMVVQRQAAKQEMERLSHLVADLQSVQKDLSEQNGILNTQVQAWTAKSQQMDQMSKELADSEMRIKKSQDSLQQAIQDLATKRAELAQQNQQLQSTEERVSQNLREIEDRIAIKQKQVAVLNGQIREKIDQLKSLKGQLAS